ncbi:hypothetical protein Q5P01_002839 [Channa striata]|uniref:Uncharacterized protein n=1 Tax=Channa striata TaxID=64152 RepID=A0AA88NTH1_CHASR|nr:hypothetical protein Q5P01_002839 [Channa striata]
MTSLKTWCLLSLSVLLVLFITPTLPELLQSMSQCDGFLLEKPPQVPDILENGKVKGKNRYKIICQTYENVRRFVTLYDTKNKIPVFSAYKYRGETGNRPRNIPWKIEPQLEDPKKNKNMEDCGRAVYKHHG